MTTDSKASLTETQASTEPSPENKRLGGPSPDPCDNISSFQLPESLAKRDGISGQELQRFFNKKVSMNCSIEAEKAFEITPPGNGY